MCYGSYVGVVTFQLLHGSAGRVFHRPVTPHASTFAHRESGAVTMPSLFAAYRQCRRFHLRRRQRHISNRFTSRRGLPTPGLAATCGTQSGAPAEPSSPTGQRRESGTVAVFYNPFRRISAAATIAPVPCGRPCRIHCLSGRESFAGYCLHTIGYSVQYYRHAPLVKRKTVSRPPPVSGRRRHSGNPWPPVYRVRRHSSDRRTPALP